MSVTALVIVLAAACAHAAWNILAHGMSSAGAPFLFAGAVAAAALWLPIVPLTGGIGTGSWPTFLIGVGVSSVLHVGYMLALQRGYRVGSLSTVYATARGSGPALTVLVAVALLGEQLTPWSLVGVLVVIAGVVAIGFVDGGGIRLSDPGVLAGLVTGAAIAAYTLWDSTAVREWGAAPVAFMVGCTVGELPWYALMLGRRRAELLPLVRRHWARLIAFGVLSPLSYILVLVAVTMAPVSLVAPLREVSVVLVSLFGALVLREGRPVARVGASLVVFAGIALIAL